MVDLVPLTRDGGNPQRSWRGRPGTRHLEQLLEGLEDFSLGAEREGDTGSGPAGWPLGPGPQAALPEPWSPSGQSPAPTSLTAAAAARLCPNSRCSLTWHPRLPSLCPPASALPSSFCAKPGSTAPEMLTPERGDQPVSPKCDSWDAPEPTSVPRVVLRPTHQSRPPQGALGDTPLGPGGGRGSRPAPPPLAEGRTTKKRRKSPPVPDAAHQASPGPWGLASTHLDIFRAYRSLLLKLRMNSLLSVPATDTGLIAHSRLGPSSGRGQGRPGPAFTQN